MFAPKYLPVRCRPTCSVVVAGGAVVGGGACCTSSVCSSSSSPVCWGSWEGSPGEGVGHLNNIYHENTATPTGRDIYLDACTGLDEVAWEPYDILLLLLELGPVPWDPPDGSRVGPSLAGLEVPAVSAGPDAAPFPSVVSDIPH